MSGTDTNPERANFVRSASRLLGHLGKKNKLGDVWCGSASFQRSRIHSIDLPSITGSKRLRVEFRNETTEPLTLCWVSNAGKLHHFYKLDPYCRHKEEEEKDKNDDIVVGDGHLETTSLGHAFVITKRPSVERNATDGTIVKDGRKDEPDDEEDDDAGSDKEDINILGPPKLRFPGRSDCWTLCDGNSDRREGLRSSTQSKRGVDPADVVGGYRPLSRTLAKAGQEEVSEERVVHIVSISRRRVPRGLRGWVYRDAPDDSEMGDDDKWKWVYAVSVREGTLDKTPLDTSGKVYRCMTLGGWQIRCEEGLWEDDDAIQPDDSEKGKEREKLQAIKERIASDLEAMSNHLPPAARELLLKSTPLWINKSQKYGPAIAPIDARDMCFHPGADWLVENGMSPKKKGGIEMYRACEYTDDCDLWGPGGLLLHEMSHSWHCQHLPDGYDNADVIACYEAAMKKGLYDSVRFHGSEGRKARAYACTDQMEYFAELSVAFLGGLDENVEHNKWFPFNRKQLREHDPKAYDMLKKMWNVCEDDPVSDEQS